MQYKVPQFIEHETKIFGPLTVKQFAVVGVAGAISFILYFSMQENFFLWIVISAILIGTALAVSFIQVEGLPLLSVIGKSFGYFLNPKTYVWRKKTYTPEFVVKREIDKKEKEKERTGDATSLKTVKESRLKRLWSEIEVK